MATTRKHRALRPRASTTRKATAHPMLPLTRAGKARIRTALRRMQARLDTRGEDALRAIEAALARLARGSYGTCVRCEQPIPLRRLEAAPTVAHCARCARRLEKTSSPAPEPGSSAAHAQLPPDLRLLTDRELAESVRELLRTDGRIDMDELRIACRHGVIYVTGTLPSDAERQIVRKLLTDVEGLEQIVERVDVNELPWERDDRVERSHSPFEDVPEELFEATRTDDAVRAEEEGISYEPPDEPPPDE